MDRLFLDEYKYVMRMALRNPNISPDILRGVVSEGFTYRNRIAVKFYAIANNVGAPEDVLSAVFFTGDPGVAELVLKNPSCPDYVKDFAVMTSK